MKNWHLNQAWIDHKPDFRLAKDANLHAAFIKEQRRLMLGVAFKLKKDFAPFKAGQTVRGTWLGDDFDSKQLRVEISPPVGRPEMHTLVALTSLIPFDILEELKGTNGLNDKDNIIPTETKSEPAVTPKNSLLDVSDKKPLLQGLIIVAGIYIGLKLFKLI